MTNTAALSHTSRLAVRAAKRFALAIAVPVVMLTASACGATSDELTAATPLPAATAPTATIYEDDPRWDCRTMGNQVCGPDSTVSGVPVPAGDYGHGDQVAGPVGPCLAGLGYAAGPVVRADAEWCAGTVVIVDGTVSDAMWENLRDLGYTGIAGDGMVALYVPADVARALCLTDAGCER